MDKILSTLYSEEECKKIEWMMESIKPSNLTKNQNNTYEMEFLFRDGVHPMSIKHDIDKAVNDLITKNKVVKSTIELNIDVRSWNKLLAKFDKFSNCFPHKKPIFITGTGYDDCVTLFGYKVTFRYADEKQYVDDYIEMTITGRTASYFDYSSMLYSAPSDYPTLNTINPFKSRITANFHRLIKKVIFNKPATIVLWKDGSKTVVKCQKGDKYDPEKGLAMAIVKYMSGNAGNFNDIFKEWIE